MLHKFLRVHGIPVHATDGDIGTVHDLYFDDQHWAVRYLVVNTGAWLLDRRVLISPMSVVKEWNVAKLPLTITKDQVRNSPVPETHPPRSRQYETSLLRHYGYPLYWGGSAVWGAYGYPAALLAGAPPEPVPVPPVAEDPGDQHLYSVGDVIGYHLHATDGEIGHVDDFLIDDRTWRIAYLEIDTSNWIGGRSVVVSPRMLQNIRWTEGLVDVDVTRDAIRNSPDLESIEVGPAELAPPFAII
jgi:uncharacterized protein YrrD